MYLFKGHWFRSPYSLQIVLSYNNLLTPYIQNTLPKFISYYSYLNYYKHNPERKCCVRYWNYEKDIFPWHAK